MKRKRAHDEKLILKHDKKDQPVPEINDGSDDDDAKKTFEVRRIKFFLIKMKILFYYRSII